MIKKVNREDLPEWRKEQGLKKKVEQIKQKISMTSDPQTIRELRAEMNQILGK